MRDEKESIASIRDDKESIIRSIQDEKESQAILESVGKIAEDQGVDV